MGGEEGDHGLMPTTMRPKPGKGDASMRRQELPSLAAMSKFGRLVSEFMERTSSDQDDVRFGSISFGNEAHPRITAPIDMPIDHLTGELRDLDRSLRGLMSAAQEAARATEDSLSSHGIESTEARQRVAVLQEFAGVAERELGRQPVSWHPVTVRTVYQFLRQHFREGAPGIAVEVKVIFVI